MKNSNASPAEIQKELKGVDCPASKQDLIDHAKSGSGGNKEVMDILKKLPDKKYNSPIDVTKAVGNQE